MIKSKIEDPVPEFSYPWLGRGDNMIVLFTKDKTGVVVQSTNLKVYDIGYHSKDWDMLCFKFIPGLKVTLENI